MAFSAAERASEVWEMGEVILFIVLTRQSVCACRLGWHKAQLQACLNSHAMAIQPDSLGFWGTAETERAARAGGGRTDPIPWMSQPSHAMSSPFFSRQCFCSSLPYCS